MRQQPTFDQLISKYYFYFEKLDNYCCVCVCGSHRNSEVEDLYDFIGGHHNTRVPPGVVAVALILSNLVELFVQAEN